MAHDPEIVFMVNATSVGGLQAGECFVTATPFGGVARPCEKITQFRLSLYEADGSIGNYSWSTQPADAVGQANLIFGAGIVGSILTLVLDVAGFGYFTAPAVTFTGGGAGGTAHSTVANGVVTSLVIDSAGSGYATGGVTLGAPTASVTATATGTQSGGIVDALVTVSAGGGYYTSAPAVTVVGGNGDATAHAVITSGAVTSIVIDNGGTGYTGTVAFTIAAPSAAVQATAHATISV